MRCTGRESEKAAESAAFFFYENCEKISCCTQKSRIAALPEKEIKYTHVEIDAEYLIDVNTMWRREGTIRQAILVKW